MGSTSATRRRSSPARILPGEARSWRRPTAHGCSRGWRMRRPCVVGCLLNRGAAAKAALEIARERGLDIVVGCSAAYGGTTFVLEDALGAGAIVDAAVKAEPSLEAGDAARFARDAFLSAQPRMGEAVASAYHARELADGGFGEDVEYCARLDVSQLVPIWCAAKTVFWPCGNTGRESEGTAGDRRGPCAGVVRSLAHCLAAAILLRVRNFTDEGRNKEQGTGNKELKPLLPPSSFLLPSH